MNYLVVDKWVKNDCLALLDEKKILQSNLIVPIKLNVNADPDTQG